MITRRAPESPPEAPEGAGPLEGQPGSVEAAVEAPSASKGYSLAPGGYGLIDLRLRARISPAELDAKTGKVLAPSDVNAVITGSARIFKPDGSLLAIVRRGAISEGMCEEAYRVLTTIRATTFNRGLASGSKRVERPGRPGNSYTVPLMSSLVGAIEPMGGRFPFCRLTAWTGTHTEQFKSLYPYFQHIATVFARDVRSRYHVQEQRAARTHADWVIPGTPFTTVTVNNTYATGVHQDAGDLKEGFSCLAVLRRGSYSGGWLCFPEYRVGVDLYEGDLILMDAHEWHGNTDLIKESEDAERISVVLYYRRNMLACASSKEEAGKAKEKWNPLDELEAETAAARTIKSRRELAVESPS